MTRSSALTTRKLLANIFNHAVDAVQPARLIRDTISLKGDTLVIDATPNPYTVPLSKYRQVFLCAIGKAALPMSQAVLDLGADWITDGVIITKESTHEYVGHIPVFKAGHPIPTQASQEAAAQLIELTRRADTNTLIINLISGGASALCASPYMHPGYPLLLEDIQAVNSLLIRSPAAINEINCVRKHLSALKGGRFLELVVSAFCINLVLSDVIGDDLGTVASGIVAPDPTTYHDALEILQRYNIDPPARVHNFLLAGLAGTIPETAKTPLPVQGVTQCIGNNMRALKSAQSRAATLGFNCTLIGAPLIGKVSDAAKWLMALSCYYAQYTAGHKLPLCILLGGETTVEVTGGGTGGRNQELALAFLELLAHNPPIPHDRAVYLLSAATDGNDGPTDAAGGFADYHALDYARSHSLNIALSLKHNDSYGFHHRCGTTLQVGTTYTNVCDIQLIVITER